MAKTIFAEESVRKSIEDLASKNTIVIGLVLGQLAEDFDHIIYLVRTPLSSQENGSDDNTAQSSVCKSPSIEDWQSDLVVQHARQVSRMLPGGFDVLGLFCCTETSQLPTSSVVLIKKILASINKMYMKSKLPSNITESEMMLLHISSAPYKFTCSVVDTSSKLADLKPLDVKIVSTCWVCLQCRITVNLTIPLAKEYTDASLVKQIRTGLEPFCVDIQEAIFTVNGQMRNHDELLNGKHKKTKRNVQSTLPRLTVDLLINTNYDQLSPSIREQDCKAVMHVRGTIQGRTYVNVKSTVGEGIEQLKLDIIRSLIGRCEIHCEDMLVIDDEHLDRVVVHELPCRVFAPLPSLDITVSDYLFPGEKAKDSLNALAELFDLSLVADDVEDSCEHLPETDDLTPLPNEEPGCTGVPVHELLPPKALPSCNYMFLGISVAVVLLAGGASLYLMQK